MSTKTIQTLQKLQEILMFSKIRIRNSITTKAALAAVAVCVASPSAMAAFVCQTPNLNLPGDISGIYINLVTGATGTSGGAVPGYDVNPYLNGPTGGITFFLPADGSGVVGSPIPPPSNTNATGGVVSVVPTAASIGPASSYSGAGQVDSGGTAFRATGTNFAGIRFQNEGTGVLNYGWLEITTTAPQGYPATLTRFCYQNDGTAIPAGSTPVTLQNFSVD